MALNFQPYQGREGEQTRARWADSLDGVFEAYQRSKQQAQAERDRVGSNLLQYGFDPRQVTPEIVRRANMGTPQGPAAPGQLSPEQREAKEHPMAGPVRAYLENKRKTAAQSSRFAESQIGENEASAKLKISQSENKDQIYVDPDTGRQIVVPKGAKLIPRISAGKQAVNPDLNSALELYETAKKGLISGLGGSETGAIVGLLPAMTAKQQIAKGSVAAMAPVLKQLFRTAGEGVFTDRDQQLLLDMVPGRTNLPEARKAMIENIDAIVKAKLKSSNRIPTEPAQESQPIALTGEKAARLAELRAKRGR